MEITKRRGGEIATAKRQCQKFKLSMAKEHQKKKEKGKMATKKSKTAITKGQKVMQNNNLLCFRLLPSLNDKK